MKVVWIGKTIVIQFTGFAIVDAHPVGHIIQPFDYSVG
jgi:hypothetical protein